MDAFDFLIKTVFDFYIMIILLRVWMQWAKTDFYTPASQFVVKLTQPIVGPLRKIVPSIGPIDTASLLFAYILACLKLLIVFKVFSVNWLFYGVLLVIKLVGLLIFWLFVIRAILSWIRRDNVAAIDYQLYQLTEPLLVPIRRFIPPFGGLDLSAMVFFFILIFLDKLATSFFPFWFIL